MFQKAMGHYSLAVSLTYLRGLEVSELEECDMPISRNQKWLVKYEKYNPNYHCNYSLYCLW